MSLTRTEAIDEMSKLFEDAWELAGQDKELVQWENVSNDKLPPKGTKAWARFVIRHSISQQASMTNAQGVKRYRRQGFLAVQIFNREDTGTVFGEMTTTVQDAFEGKATTGGVWFSEVTVKEIGLDINGWYQINVTAKFTYDTIK